MVGLELVPRVVDDGMQGRPLARPVLGGIVAFRTLPEELDPRTMMLEARADAFANVAGQRNRSAIEDVRT